MEPSDINWRDKYNALKANIAKHLGLPESDYKGPIHQGHDSADLLEAIKKLREANSGVQR